MSTVAFVLCRCGCGGVASILDDRRRRRTGYRRGHNPQPQTRGICTIEGCSRPHAARGLCRMHYTRHRKHGDVTRGKTTASERFWAKVEKTSGCWYWRGAVAGRYGRFWVGSTRSDGRLLQAHRFAYELLIGPIPPELTIDHLCLNKLCVNPDHMEPVTGAENTRRHIQRVNGEASPSLRSHRKETGSCSPPAK